MKDFSEYTTTLPYASIKKDPNVHAVYVADVHRLKEEFKRDLFADLDIISHPKASMLFGMAWERGHASGYSEVYNEALDLVDLIK